MRTPTLLAVLAALGVGCASGPARPVVSPPEPLRVVREPEVPRRALPAVRREGAGDAVVARIGDAEIRRSDIGDFVIRYYRDQAGEALTHLVDEAVLRATARAEGIEVAEDLVSRELGAELADRERRIRVQFGPDVGLEEYLRERYGIALGEHREDLRRLVETRLLRDRVIRYRQMRVERAEVRDAVFADAATAAEAARAAARGADLGALAEARGVRKGTALPPVPREELSPPDLADRVFALAEGGVSDVIEVEEGGRKLYHVFKMVRLLPARNVRYAEVREEVERSLSDRPLESWEYAQWARQVREEQSFTIVR